MSNCLVNPVHFILIQSTLSPELPDTDPSEALENPADAAITSLLHPFRVRAGIQRPQGGHRPELG